MKKSINQWCFPMEWSWEKTLDLTKEAGFDGIELCIDYLPFFEAMGRGGHEGLIADIARSVGSTLAESKSLRFDSSEKELHAVRSMIEERSLHVSTLLTIAQFYYSLIHDDGEIRNTGIELMKKLIGFAVQLGAPALLVVPGVVTSTIGYDEAYKRLEDSIWKLKEEAEKAGVGLGVENIWGKILYSPLEMRDFVDIFKSRYVGVHFDVGNVIQYGYPDQWIRILGKRLLNIHLKDYSETINNIRGFTHLFQGSVPWARVMDALREVGYDGYLIAEVPPYPFCPEEGIWDIARKMNILIEGSF